MAAYTSKGEAMDNLIGGSRVVEAPHTRAEKKRLGSRALAAQWLCFLSLSFSGRLRLHEESRALRLLARCLMKCASCIPRTSCAAEGVTGEACLAGTLCVVRCALSLLRGLQYGPTVLE